MKKLKKKLVVVLLIIAIVFATLSNLKSNAEFEIGEEPDVNVVNGIVREPNKVEANGVKLISEPVYEGYPEAEVHIRVDNYGMNDAVLAGFEGQLYFEGAFPTGELVVDTNGWQATSNVDRNSNCINFAVEPISLSNIPSEPQITIKYTLDNVDQHVVYINKWSFKKTDLQNNVYKPLEGLSDVPFDFNIELNVLPTAPITSDDPSSIRIFGDKMLVKFEGYRDGENQNVVINPIVLLYDMIRLNVGNWRTLTITTDNDSLIVENGNNFPIDDRLVTSGNNIKLTLAVDNLAGGTTEYEYDVIQMGNVYYDDVISATGAININDVMALRQAVVGMNSIFNNPRFHIEASDVNFSNEICEDLGDIGDIISIRQRILNYYWLDK